MIYLILFLILFDCVILYLLMNRRASTGSSEQPDSIEERQYLIELRKSVEDRQNYILERCQNLQKSMTQLAMEAEQEVKKGSSTISKELEGVVDQLTTRFHEPLNALQEAKQQIDTLLRRVHKEKTSLIGLLERSEDVIEAMDKSQSSSDIIGDIREKRYQRARQMIAGGISLDAISQELNLPLNEVRLLAGISF